VRTFRPPRRPRDDRTSIACAVRLATFVAICSAPALAQTAPPSPSAQASPNAALPPGSAKAPTFDGLLGDFGNGTRSDLAKHGFSVNGHLTTESAANLSGGFPLGGTAHARGTAASTEFGFGFDLDFDKLYAGSGAGVLHFLMTTRFGSNLSSQALGNLVSVEEIYGDGQTTRITFLDYEQPFSKKRFDLRLGKYNQQNDFIAGSTYWGAICTASIRTTISAARPQASRITTASAPPALKATRIIRHPSGARGSKRTYRRTSTCRPPRFKAILSSTTRTVVSTSASTAASAPSFPPKSA